MDIFVNVLLAGLGLIFGSFVNAMVWRLHAQDEIKDRIDELNDTLTAKKALPKREVAQTNARITKLRAELAPLSMSTGRSMCSNCHHPLAPKDLIPLLSWLYLRGKCRYCRKPIEDTPLLEAGLPVIFVLSYLCWPTPLSSLTSYSAVSFVLWLIFLVGFAFLTAYDIRWFLLPDRVVWPLALLAFLQVLLHATVFGGGLASIVAAFWGVVVCSGIFYALFMVSKGEWIGGGDVKLGIVLGLLVGGPVQGMLLIFAASLFGTLGSLPLLLQKKMQRTSIIPFGPFLMLACVVITLFGHQLVDWFNHAVLLSV